MAACLPEQFIRILDSSSPRRIMRRAVSISSGQPAGQRRSSSLRPAPDKIFRTPSTWKSSPEWLPPAPARRAPPPPKPPPDNPPAPPCLRRAAPPPPPPPRGGALPPPCSKKIFFIPAVCPAPPPSHARCPD